MPQKALTAARSDRLEIEPTVFSGSVRVRGWIDFEEAVDLFEGKE